jgi:hypothetical protein
MKSAQKNSVGFWLAASQCSACLLAVALIGCTGHPKAPPSHTPEGGRDGSVAPEVDASVAPERDAAVTPQPGDDMLPGDTTPDGGVTNNCAVPPHQPSGQWTTGDLHNHTIESDDAQVPLSVSLDQAFNQNHLDWIALSNHLRVSSRDNLGNKISPGPIPMSHGVDVYEQPAIVAMQASGLYAAKTIFSSVEWDVPSHDHMNVGVVSSAPQSEDAIKALNHFEYLFTTRDPSMFNPADVASWGTTRYNMTHDDALKAIAWLKDNYPDSSYSTINHAFRYPTSYTISDFREFNDLAPNVVFAIEGMVGNQMEPNRGGYANAQSPTYGGVDGLVATVGGMWDALLGEGRRIWNIGDSDFHFKTAGGKFSSGYFPGEYTKTYVWVDGEGMPAILAGLHSGKAFSVYGDLISALDFNISACAIAPVEMGGELRVPNGSKIQITIRWKSELPSNYETPVGSGHKPGMIPVVDHVDLIAGDVTAKAQPGTPGYNNATNPSTHVVSRFSAAAATKDADGYNVVTYEVTATKNQYFRLRGTNLGTDVAGQTQNGEPLADVPNTETDDQTRFNAINDRNYADLWFYSNPIFVTVN